MGDPVFMHEDHDIARGYMGFFADDMNFVAFDKIMYFPLECQKPYEELRAEAGAIPIPYGPWSSRYLE